MAMYRCAACGSPNVVKDTQTGELKYNYVKGAVGTALLGVGGAVAGVENKTQQVFKCPDCGATLTYTMDPELCNAIDIGLMSETARNNLTVYGVHMRWDFLASKYKNIGYGEADQRIAEKERKIASSFENAATATQEAFDSAVQTLVEIQNEKYSEEKLMPKAVFDQGKQALYTFIENMSNYLPPERIERLAEDNYDAEYKGLSVRKENLTYLVFEYLIFWLYDYKGLGKLILASERNYKEKLLIQDNNFAKAFLRKYKDYLNIGYASEKDCLEYNRRFHGNLIGSSDGLFWTTRVSRISLDETSSLQVWLPVYCPKYIYHSGHVHFIISIQTSFGSSINDFWAAYPIVKKQLDECIDGRKQEIQASKDYDKRMKELNEERDRIKPHLAEIQQKEQEINIGIRKLSHKIFGKAKAQAEIENLQAELSSLNQEQGKLENRLTEIEKQKKVPRPICRGDDEWEREFWEEMGDMLFFFDSKYM